MYLPSPPQEPLASRPHFPRTTYTAEPWHATNNTFKSSKCGRMQHRHRPSIDPAHARVPAAMPPRQPSSSSSSSSSPSSLPSSPSATAAPPGAPSCLPADQSCFTVSVGAHFSSSRHDAAGATTAAAGTRACCTTTSYITVLGISFGSLLVILLILCAIRWYLVRRSASRDAAAATAAAEPEKKQPKGLDADAIAALPEFVYRKAEDASGDGEEDEPELECSVCLAAMADGDAARRLPSCMHVFHRSCVDVWLRERSTCPVCRAEVVDVRSSGEGCDGKDQEGGGPPSVASTSMAWTALEEFVDDGERDLEAQI